MLLSALSLAALACSAIAVPAAVPLTSRQEININQPLPFSDGFPNPTEDQLNRIIALKSRGTLSSTINSGVVRLSGEGAINLRLLNLFETVEAVFYNQLLYNVTNWVDGFQPPPWIDYDYFVEFLTIARADAEMHALDAARTMTTNGQTVPRPCTRYNFPVSTLNEAIEVASMFTSLASGMMADLNEVFAKNGDWHLVRGIGAALAQEGETNGFLRYILNKTPAELPFTTATTRDLALSQALRYVDTSSCPDLGQIKLKVFGQLDVLDAMSPYTQPIRFRIDADKYKKNTQYYVVYVNQLNKPVVEPASFESQSGAKVVLTASFPYGDKTFNGLTLALVTDQKGPFTDVIAVNRVAIWGPGMIVVN